MLTVAIAGHLAIAVIDGVNVALLTSAIDDPSGSADQIELRDELTTVTAIIALAVSLPAMIAWMVWMTRAYGNLDALAPAAKRHWTGWAWLGWIVPIMNLFRPKQVANDIWRASAPGSLPAWLQAWWTLWIVTEVAVRILGRVDVESLAQFRWLDGVDGLLNLVIAVTGVLAIRVVRRLTSNQEEHSRRPPPEPAPERSAGASPPADGERPDGFTITPGWAPSGSS
jgi:hypothetical protein